MKRHRKLLISISSGILLLGMSGAAIAANCAGGVINNRTVDNIIVEGTSCYVSETIVRGRVIVQNSPSFAMINNRVLGRVVIRGPGNVLLKDNELFDDALSVNAAGIVWVFNNSIQGDPERSNILLQRSTDEVQVYNNRVDGNLLCVDNMLQIASGNVVGGRNTCIPRKP